MLLEMCVARTLLSNKTLKYLKRRFASWQNTSLQGEDPSTCPGHLQFSKPYEDDAEHKLAIINDMIVHPNFITVDEEQSILDEIEPYLSRMRYEMDHWDDAIHGYRETERLKWNDRNEKILDKVRKIAFPSQVKQLKYVHVLDLQKDGHIKPHIDAVRFCGDTIAGLSLLTDSIMRLVHDKRQELIVDILLERRSLYIMKNTARYDYTHEILANNRSDGIIFNGKSIEKSRRISIICRNAPSKDPLDIH